MGKFTDTKYINTIDSIVSASNDKLNNPYYIFTDKKPTAVTYYRQNKEQSTLDEASGLYEAHVGSGSPFKFNKIKNFVLYGLDRIQTEYDVGDFGTEAASITGDALILPNTIEPRVGDFFSIPYLKESILFKVNAVSPDTLDNGFNAWRLEYALELTDSIDAIEAQVVKEYTFVAGNIGTDFSCMLTSDNVELVDKLEALINTLTIYFQNIFFDAKLQTFVFTHDGYHMYDPFLIEFLIRNKVLAFSDEYVYVSHAAAVNKTFGMDYLKTFFYALEHPDENINCSNIATADMITDPNSLFVTRMDDYYAVRYVDKTPYKTRFTIIDMDIIEHIKSNTLYETGDSKEYYNLWISFFNGDTDFIKGDLLSLLRKTDYMDNLECFYALAISIYIMEQYIYRLMKEE